MGFITRTYGGYELDGRPLNCGVGLELRMPGNRWQPVRFEMTSVIGSDWAPEGTPSHHASHAAVLYMEVGHAFEERFEARVDRTGWRLWDHKRQVYATLSEREPVEGLDEGRPVYGDTWCNWSLEGQEVDTWSDRNQARQMAVRFNMECGAGPSVVVIPTRETELRWPRRHA